MGSRCRRYVSGDNRKRRIFAFDLFHLFGYHNIVAVGGIHRKNIHARFIKSVNSFHRIRRRTYRSSGEKSALLILCASGVLNGLFDVFYGNKSLEDIVFVHYGELFYSVFSENLLSLVEGSAYRRGNEILFRHNIGNRLFEVGFETEVAVCKNTYEVTFPVDDRNARDFISRHKSESVRNGIFRVKEERVGDNAVFASFDSVYHKGLFFYGHILMNYAHAAFASHSYRELIFRNGIHSRADERNIELYVRRKLNAEIDFARKDVAFCGDDENVVERQGLFDYLIH